MIISDVDAIEYNMFLRYIKKYPKTLYYLLNIIDHSKINKGYFLSWCFYVGTFVSIINTIKILYSKHTIFEKYELTQVEKPSSNITILTSIKAA